MDLMKFVPSTHGLWNLAEKLTDIEGPGFVEADAPLPYMSAGTDLVRTDLCVMGGKIEVPTLQAAKFGGPSAFFARRQDHVLRKSGMTTERQIVLNNWLKGAREEKNLRDAGGTGEGHFILAVRFDDLANIGLFDPDQFDSGRFFRIDLSYGGQEHELHSPRYQGVLGYAIVYRAIFGWQMLDAKRTVSAIVNVTKGKAPTADQIDDMLADVRATPGNTYLVMGPKARIHGINPHKKDYLQMAPGDRDPGTPIDTWNGIPIVVSYNFAEPMKNITVK